MSLKRQHFACGSVPDPVHCLPLYESVEKRVFGMRGPTLSTVYYAELYVTARRKAPSRPLFPLPTGSIEVHL
jgi:hypothetical protein